MIPYNWLQQPLQPQPVWGHHPPTTMPMGPQLGMPRLQGSPFNPQVIQYAQQAMQQQHPQLPTTPSQPSPVGLFAGNQPLPPPDLPPADPTTDYNYGNGPTVQINPPGTPYVPPFSGAPAPRPIMNNPANPGPQPDPYGGIPGSPWYTAGPFPGGNTNPANPGYVNSQAHPYEALGQGGWSGTGASFNFLMGHQQL